MPNSVTEALQELIDPDRGINIIEGDYTFVKVVNKSSFSIKMEWNSRKYHIQPNSDRLVPYFCMVHYCGDPRSFDVPGDMRRRFRSDEWGRLRVLYGVYEHTSDANLMSQIPELEVYTPSGKLIPTVLNDPEGDALADHVANISDVDAARLEAEALRKQLAQVVGRLDTLENNSKPVDPMAVSELDESRRTDTPLISSDSPDPDLIPPEDIVLSAEDLLSTSAANVPTKKPSSKA